ncbi:MAG: hypothetical protein HW406_1170, partial [Candidatus Brocadiaceae bacterium]|nr:hypothetical protein [Candidatus Brocadiaceae bacterium]
ALSSAHQVFAQETYDFNGSIQVKVGKKKIKEEVGGTVDVFISEEENDEDFVKKGNSKSSHDDYDDEGTFESATFSFDFGADDTECGDTLDEESIEVDAEPQEDGGGGSKRNVRIELDQNAMTDLIGRILEKYGATVQEALDLDDCFSTTGGGGEQNVNFWVNYVSGTAYVKSNYIKISFSGNAEIQISDQDHQNQQRYTQRISGKLKIEYPDPDH